MGRDKGVKENVKTKEGKLWRGEYNDDGSLVCDAV